MSLAWFGSVFPNCSTLLSPALACSRLLSPALACSRPLSPALAGSRLLSPALACSRLLSLLASHLRALLPWSHHAADPRRITSTCAYLRVARSALTLTIPSPGDDRRHGIVASVGLSRRLALSPGWSLPAAASLAPLVSPSGGNDSGLSQTSPSTPAPVPRSGSSLAPSVVSTPPSPPGR